MTRRFSSDYIGRFAPSPSGELHHGSLLTAVASYLDARHHNGLWLVRMEDLDPPREQAGAAASILRTLESHHLFWDGPIMYQSKRYEAYQEALDQLQRDSLLYHCNCTRQRLQTLEFYDGHCLSHPPAGPPWATRIKVPRTNAAVVAFFDLFQGDQQQDLRTHPGDFVVRRKDGLFAYQLAVVVDDIFQQVTHIIRGSDLLDSTLRQAYLFQQLHSVLPVMGHLPVLTNDAGQKLSKQNHAQPLDNRSAAKNLLQTLHYLNLNPPKDIVGADCSDLLRWATTHWRRDKIPSEMQIDIGNLPTS